MIREFKKGEKVDLSPHFSTTEFDCNCTYEQCEQTLIDTDLIYALELLRSRIGPLQITSGYRCSAYNKKIKGKPGSIHLQGKAADVTCEKGAPTLAFAADSVPAFHNGGIGRYPNFTHLDVRGYKARWEEKE